MARMTSLNEAPPFLKSPSLKSPSRSLKVPFRFYAVGFLLMQNGSTFSTSSKVELLPEVFASSGIRLS